MQHLADPNRALHAINNAPAIAQVLQHPPFALAVNLPPMAARMAPAQPLRGRGGPGRGGAAKHKLGLQIFLQHYPNINLQQIQQLILACHTDWETSLCVGLNRSWMRLKRLCPALCIYLKKSEMLSLIHEVTGPPLNPELQIHYSCYLSQFAQGRLQETDPVILHPRIHARMHVPAYLNREFHQYPLQCWILDRSRPKRTRNDDATDLQQFWILVYLQFENNDMANHRRVIHRRRYILNSNTKLLSQVLMQYRIRAVLNQEGTPQVLYHDQSSDLCLQDVIAARQYLETPAEGLQLRHSLRLHSYGVIFRCQAEVEASISLAKKLKRKAIARGLPNWRQFVAHSFVESNF